MASVGINKSFQRKFAIQSWTMYGIGIFIIAVRTFSRWRRVGRLSQLAIDDWIMVTAVPLFYTGLIVCLNIIISGVGSNLFPPEQFETFSQREVDERIAASKIMVVSEQCMLNVIWVLKGCMLLMLARMTTGTSFMKWIRIVGIWAAAGYVAVQIAFFTACRPFKGYWRMPPPNAQCATLQHYAYVQAVFNISSDLLIIAIPLPMLASLNLSVRQKLGLGFLFTMGIFVILAAILTKYFDLSDIYSTEYTLWYTREASVAVYATNMPGIWPLLREHIGFLRGTGGTTRPGYGSQYGHMSKATHSHGRTLTNIADDEVELGTAYAHSAAESVHSTDGAHSEVQGLNLFTNSARKLSEHSDEKALIVDLGGRKSVLGMGVQVDTKIEIQRGDWGGSRVEAGESQTVKIEGPDAQCGRRQ